MAEAPESSRTEANARAELHVRRERVHRGSQNPGEARRCAELYELLAQEASACAKEWWRYAAELGDSAAAAHVRLVLDKPKDPEQELRLGRLRAAVHGILCGAKSEGFLTDPVGMLSIYGAFIAAVRAEILGEDAHTAINEEMQRAEVDGLLVRFNSN